MSSSKNNKPTGVRKYSKAGNKDKPAELFRTDFISNMKIADCDGLDTNNYLKFTDQWRHEWNCGVQVPITEDDKSPPRAAVYRVENVKANLPKVEKPNCPPEDADSQYDMDNMDIIWLRSFNEELKSLGLPPLNERLFEFAMQNLELAVHGKPVPTDSVANQPASELDDLVCDVCLSPNGEENNDIVFCDNCNVGVHQMCYGVQRIPKGSWYCRPCSLGVRPRCVLCPNKGGAMKSTRACDKWIHVSCALWIPEVIFENIDTMEPATNLDKVPESRFNIRCSLCTSRAGAVVQCSSRTCRSAFHVTCAQRQGLQLVTVPGFEIYCAKHFDPERVTRKSLAESKSPISHSSNARPNEWLANLRPYFLRNLLSVHQLTASGVFYYWRLKKLSQFGQPLIRLGDSDTMIRRQQEETLLRRIQMLMFLRQNMEKARNLCYMVEKREKLKRQMYNTAIDRVRSLNDGFESSNEDVKEEKVHNNAVVKPLNGVGGDSPGGRTRKWSRSSPAPPKMNGFVKEYVKNRTKSVERVNVQKRNGTTLFVGVDGSAKRVRRPNTLYSP